MTMNKDRVENEEVYLVDLLKMIKTKWLNLVIAFVVGAMISGVITIGFINPVYKASTIIYIVGTTSEDSGTVSELQLGSSLSSSITKDYQELILTKSILEPVINRLNLECSYESLRKTVEITNTKDTRCIVINVKNTDPELAAKIADEISRTAIDKISPLMKTDKPTLFEEASVPSHPISPSVSKNTVLGGLVLFIVVLNYIIFKYLLDDTLKTEEDAAKYLGLNTIANLPDTKESVKKNIKNKKKR